MSAPVDVLRNVPLFADLDDEDLAGLANQMKERRYAEGRPMTSEGSGGAGFFVITEGNATVSVGGEAKTTLGPGDYFGEIALIDEGARLATITATSELGCYGITFWDFRPLVESNGVVGWKLLQSLATRLREANET